MHLKRWISSIIALPIVLYLIFSGGMPFLFLMIAVCAICLWEYFSIVFNNKHKNNLIIWLGFLLGIIIIIAAYEKSYDLILLIAAFDLICCALISIAASKTESSLLEAVSKQVQGIIYIPIFLAFLVLIRNDINGNIWIFYILFIIFAGDIGAYYIGTHFGRHKLIPIVSPGKTLEGAIAGLASNIIIGSIINYFMTGLPWGLDMLRLPWGRAIILFLTIGVAGQIGDLFESQLKRNAKIKDSGKIMPGHGGLLDRIDALLFAAPAAYYFKMYVF